VFNTCSVCGASLRGDSCATHADAKAIPALVISGILDDGTGNIRFVLFRELAEQLAQMAAETLAQTPTEERYSLLTRQLLGRQLLMRGRVRRNPRTERLELLVNQAEDINILAETNRLVELTEAQVG
jgi:DNA/RNA endonuclease YhcR with UshA esterase domain